MKFVSDLMVSGFHQIPKINKTDRHDIIEILLKVELDIIHHKSNHELTLLTPGTNTLNGAMVIKVFGSKGKSTKRQNTIYKTLHI